MCLAGYSMDYLPFFKLADEPYSYLKTNPRFFYNAPQYRSAKAILKDGISTKSAHLYLTGPVGSGKTTLLRVIEVDLKTDQNNLVYFTYAPRYLRSAHSFLKRLCEEMGIKTARSYVDMLSNFENQIGTWARENKTPVLLIDEAHKLTAPAFDFLHHIWKQTNHPNAIKTNPAGLLRTAIEKNFAAEGHKGYQTRQQKAEASLAKKQRLRARERRVKADERQQATILQQKETERLQRLQKLREQYHTREREMKLWSRVLQTFKEQMSRASFNIYLASSTLLSLRKGKAVIAVPNRFVKRWLEDHLLSKIQQALGDHLKGQTVTVQCLRLDKLNDES
jgi:energy-coupling factor transporter ATP-binding protein EcfA2